MIRIPITHPMMPIPIIPLIMPGGSGKPSPFLHRLTSSIFFASQSFGLRIFKN